MNFKVKLLMWEPKGIYVRTVVLFYCYIFTHSFFYDPSPLTLTILSQFFSVYFYIGKVKCNILPHT